MDWWQQDPATPTDSTPSAWTGTWEGGSGGNAGAPSWWNTPQTVTLTPAASVAAEQPTQAAADAPAETKKEKKEEDDAATSDTEPGFPDEPPSVLLVAHADTVVPKEQPAQDPPQPAQPAAPGPVAMPVVAQLAPAAETRPGSAEAVPPAPKRSVPAPLLPAHLDNRPKAKAHRAPSGQTRSAEKQFRRQLNRLPQVVLKQCRTSSRPPSPSS